MKQSNVSKKKIVLVEGPDEDQFVSKLLRRVGRDDIEVFSADGKDRINDAIGAITFFEGFDDVTHFGVIRDADEDASAAFQSVQHGLRKFGLPVPDVAGTPKDNGSRTSCVLILPGNGERGMLETMVWNSLAAHPVAAAAEGFLERCRAILPKDVPQGRPHGPEGWGAPRNVDKARILALLSTMIEPEARVGLAAQKNYFDLAHDAFRPLADFLQGI